MPASAPLKQHNDLLFYSLDDTIIAKYLASPFLFILNHSGIIKEIIHVESEFVGPAFNHDPEEPFINDPSVPSKFPDNIRYRLRLYPTNGDISLINNRVFYHIKKDEQTYTTKVARTYFNPTLERKNTPLMEHMSLDYENNYMYFNNAGNNDGCIYRVKMDWLH